MEATTVITSFDTSVLLKEYCDRKRIHKAALSRKMGIKYDGMLKNLKAKNLYINRLIDFSHGLQHNFLLDIAVQLPAHYTTAAVLNAAETEEIAALKERIKILEAENALLLKIRS